MTTKQVGYFEKGACPAYAETAVMAMTPTVLAPSQGGSGDICLLMFLFIGSVKGAEVDLQLISAALPKPPEPPEPPAGLLLSHKSKSHKDNGVISNPHGLKKNLKVVDSKAGLTKEAKVAIDKVAADAKKVKTTLHAGFDPEQKEAGVNTPRGRAWLKWLTKNNVQINRFAVGDGSASDGMSARAMAQSVEKCDDKVVSLVAKFKAMKESKFVEEGGKHGKGDGEEEAEEEEEDPVRGLPRYHNHPVCKSYNQVTPGVQYIILPGTPDGLVPPVQTDGPLFEHCVNQFSEIMAGFAQTGAMTIQMTKDWCNWKASVQDWTGTSQEYGRPDWSFRNCNNMASVLGFALRNTLDDGLPAMKVCKNIFLSLGAVHRVDSLVADAWSASLRGLGSLGLATSVDGDAAKAVMDANKAYQDKIVGKMRAQKEAFNEANR